MARSLIERRQEAERARIEAYEASLRRVSQRARPAPDFETALDEAKRGFERSVVRDAWAWRPQMKTRDPARLRLAAARHLFARYPVAEHLERVWTDPIGLDGTELSLRKSWYVAAASGGSLYKAGAGEWLSRKEVHAFLNPFGRLEFEQVIWQAVARTYADNPAFALLIARSRIGLTPRSGIGQWREAVRFFAANPTTVEQINDLRDYLTDCYARDPSFSLKGRTLVSLQRQMLAWHQDLTAVARIEEQRQRADAARARARGEAAPRRGADGGAWAGAALADWHWSSDPKLPVKRVEAMVIQLKTAADLVTETRAMRHCVSTYAAKCIQGQTSIWSVRRRVAGVTERLLTVELDQRLRAVQVRGHANRLPYPDERAIVERWAKARGITLV